MICMLDIFFLIHLLILYQHKILIFLNLHLPQLFHILLHTYLINCFKMLHTFYLLFTLSLILILNHHLLLLLLVLIYMYQNVNMDFLFLSFQLYLPIIHPKVQIYYVILYLLHVYLLYFFIVSFQLCHIINKNKSFLMFLLILDKLYFINLFITMYKFFKKFNSSKCS